MYEVIQEFVDLHDADYHYHVGDKYPRKGIRVTASRINELSGKDNKQGAPLIAKVEKEKEEE
ncbi:MAG: hypothetical protein LUD72_11480 [Bacteroidales bacterium]|nr:hypothetical protein [Bacteroidales bacterium]